MTWIMPLIIGILTGILSGMGIGGGTLLILYLTAVCQVEQQTAGGINLLYFILCAPMALIGYIRDKQLDSQSVKLCTFTGIATALLFSWLATAVNTQILHRLFSVFLLFVGIKEILAKPKTD